MHPWLLGFCSDRFCFYAPLILVLFLSLDQLVAMFIDVFFIIGYEMVARSSHEISDMFARSLLGSLLCSIPVIDFLLLTIANVFFVLDICYDQCSHVPWSEHAGVSMCIPWSEHA